MLVDSHCHLEYPAFEQDFEAMMTRASAAGVGTMLTICTTLSGFEQVRAIAEARDNVWCTVGVHPHEAEPEGVDRPDRLIELSAHARVVGIGETGLDYYYDHSPREAQRTNFRAHIAAARQTGLPLIVHTRDADGETMDILEEEHAKGAFDGVIHCFSASQTLATRALELGLLISFSGIVTFRKAEAVQAVARTTPLDRILVETDAPYLAPMPNRGKRNEPAFVSDTAAFVAKLRGVETDELARVTTDNFYRLFSKATRAA
ncbi:MAG: TatD family hydrolase [Alphaproteobacteria bacterium]|nr:TatD family hydrolase [Alphaproteobacteria bacterium]